MVDVDVLVVGAGPVGLTAAAELRRHGADCRIVDRLAAPQHYAKAVGVQPRTLEVWDTMGLARQALAEALPLRGQLTWIDGREQPRVELKLPPEVPYGFAALPQYATEELLAGHLATYGTRVERGLELVSFAQDPDGVDVELRTPGGVERLRCRYLVGCDGAHSAVRKGLGLDFGGGAFADSYMLGDVEVDWDLPAGYALRVVRHAADSGPDDLLVAVPLPGRGRYRLSAIAAPDLVREPGGPGGPGGVAHGLDAGGRPELAHLQAVVDRLAPRPASLSALRWSSVFRISHRIVNRYGEGRVFIAGDAAHIHPPTGGQGLNTGVQDAYNLAWKLALVLRGAAGPALLDSYDAERRPVGEEVVGRTVRHARTDTGRDEDGAGAGDGVERALIREAQLLIGYPDSPLVSQDDVGGSDGLPVRPGDRAPDCAGLAQPLAAFPQRLFDLLRSPRHTLLLYAGRAAADGLLERCAAAAREAAHGALDVYVVLAPGRAGDEPAGDGPALPVVHDEREAFRTGYGARDPEAFVIRPDGYLAGRVHPLDPEPLAAVLRRTFGPA
ncbi:FAD-dependent oxidoreductase [Kitasatospora paracochleata]|uniref:2-polyprenyl-6-methoxyphenol hydroxylase-like FAD-dependent oxidoreductase n=1 Tax=Kitasatospora paracochleata TaxID=58354 RepID=A0ABT1IV30_9ACTN|nr:FAD-dependent monooxygenase [Kitasatospora paracochleata]MCP2308992.1 2-polyprenyl-6-methoxyphenol hydroxylase-like FAD-dependent oxidoreductase [Kitasatospora paracochleata]